MPVGLTGALPSPTAWRKKESKDFSRRDPIQRRSGIERYVKRKRIPLTPLVGVFLLSSISFSLAVFSFHRVLQSASDLDLRARVNERIKPSTGVYRHILTTFLHIHL